MARGGKLRSANAQRACAKLRTTLIGYGIGAYALFQLGPWSDAAAQAGSFASSRGYLLSGLGVQVFVIFVRVLIKRRIPDPGAAGRAMLIAELIGDGATVLLFALATLGVVTHAADTF